MLNSEDKFQLYKGDCLEIMKKRNNLKNRNIEKSNQYMIIFKEVQQMACKPKKKSKSTGKKKK